jgi:hypothetical protein
MHLLHRIGQLTQQKQVEIPAMMSNLMRKMRYKIYVCKRGGRACVSFTFSLGGTGYDKLARNGYVMGFRMVGVKFDGSACFRVNIVKAV